ncbi:MAG TPA: PilZ domain-containing protein [Kofleriaceae bacterium]|nr:PilZ domain-containing protein [Kofleriaceae bacterium]
MLSLDLVFRYRTLLGKCESGVGLDFDEIDALTQIEAAFASGEPARDGRKWKRIPVELSAMVRGGDLNDKVAVSELAPGGLVVHGAPYVDTGMQVEIVIDDIDLAMSYRFKARVQWMREDAGDDYQLGLELVGMPVLIHYGPASADKTQEMERIAA